MTIKIYNTMTRMKEDFKPIKEGHVGIYACGPTVYNYFHIGNARPFIFFDVVRRYLKYKGYDVTFVQNLTDVDDKIIERAKQEGKQAEEVASFYTKCYFEDAEALGIGRADYHPKATQTIPEIVELVKTLQEKGFAYEVEGDVYYDISKFKRYGALSQQNLGQLQAGARVKVDERLKDPLDFALWKSAKPGEPSWDSPWGKGRPGWHIECSVMSMKYLGESFDIHCGGLDLIFPHHENEIAQSEAATGKKFVNYWLHNGYVNIEGEKMSKSLGNITLARDLLKRWPVEVLRFFVLSGHYRKPLDFTLENLQASQSALERVSIALQKMSFYQKDSEDVITEYVSIAPLIEQLRDQFEEAMDDDFNTPLALAAFFEFIKEVNKLMDECKVCVLEPEELKKGVEVVRKLGKVLGLFQGKEVQTEGLASNLVELLIELRNEARQAKDFQKADLIRQRMAQLGILLEDGPEKTTWRFSSS